jgi:hypothetical protein
MPLALLVAGASLGLLFGIVVYLIRLSPDA